MMDKLYKIRTLFV